MEPGDTIAFLCCDLQTKFEPLMPRFAAAVHVANRFARASEIFGFEEKFITTEQYPKGLGHTVPQITLPSDAPKPFAKTSFSMMIPEVQERLGLVQGVVLFGIEAHVCVLQTAADVAAEGRPVFVAADGTFSQRDDDREHALQLLRQMPHVHVSTSESILLQLVGDASSRHMKPIQQLLKQRI